MEKERTQRERQNERYEEKMENRDRQNGKLGRERERAKNIEK